MLQTKYDVWMRNGTEEFFVIPVKDFQAMRERLEDDADFRAIEASKKRQAKSPRTSLQQLKQELGLIQEPKRRR
jgi:PHD/YefM family antitoxin component YafN of YafNO toxin-antitoxin module